MTSTTLLLLPLIAAGALCAVITLPSAAPAQGPARYVPLVPDDVVEQDLEQGCRHLVGLIERRDPHASWAVGKLLQAVDAPYLGPSIRSLAHQGLAVAFREGVGITADARRAEFHDRDGLRCAAAASCSTLCK
jgi:hypothetical protein